MFQQWIIYIDIYSHINNTNNRYTDSIYIINSSIYRYYCCGTIVLYIDIRILTIILLPVRRPPLPLSPPLAIGL